MAVTSTLSCVDFLLWKPGKIMPVKLKEQHMQDTRESTVREFMVNTVEPERCFLLDSFLRKYIPRKTGIRRGEVPSRFLIT
jgi:hypothetical protein